jgi:hypothetical protein
VSAEPSDQPIAEDSVGKQLALGFTALLCIAVGAGAFDGLDLLAA